MRRKFRLLFKIVYKYTKEVHITDKTYRFMLDPQNILQEASRGSITQGSADIIADNINFFKLPHWEGDEKNTRSKESSQSLLQKIRPHTCITELVNAIITLQGALPQSQGFKLDQKCERKIKVQQKRGHNNQESRKELSFSLNDQCLIPTCFHNFLKENPINRLQEME